MSALEAFVVPMTRDEAERVSMRIALKLDSASDSWNGAVDLIRDALARDAYAVLGYASHGAYVADRFGGALAKLGVELRREVVRELTDAGLSTRAISPVFDVSQKTIVKDLQVIPPVSPDPEPPVEKTIVVGATSPGEAGAAVEEPPVSPPAAPAAPSSDLDDAEIWDAGGSVDVATGEVVEPEPEPRSVQGMDGKTYTVPAKKAERRKSLVDEAYAVERTLFKAFEKLRDITNDDRFNKNKASIQDVVRPVADLAREILADLFDNQSLED